MTESGTSLRERKKQRTRQALIDAATRLYRTRGWANVTIAEIAREADVAPRTFFGYFATKEDVFLEPGDARFERLIRAIRGRDRGEGIVMAVQRALLVDREPVPGARPVGRPDLSELLHQPAFANRLRERWIRWEDQLATAIAIAVGAGPDDPEPRVVAAAVIGAVRVAAAAAESAADPGRRRAIAERAFGILGPHLLDFGTVPPRDAG